MENFSIDSRLALVSLTYIIMLLSKNNLYQRKCSPYVLYV